jgi:rod shape-determining protein MreD
MSLMREFNRHGPREEILLPVRLPYVLATLLGAIMLNLLPVSGWMAIIRPDFIAFGLVYWGVHEPRKVGLWLAWLFGLMMDVADGSLFGEHALSYAVLLALAISMRRRVPMFSIGYQMLHVFVVLLACQLMILAVRTLAGAEFPGWWYFLDSVTGALLWPIGLVVLRIPLRPKLNQI